MFEKAKVKMWQYILVYTVCLIPILNVLVLFYLLIHWIMNAVGGDEDYTIKCKYIDKIKDFLNKEL